MHLLYALEDLPSWTAVRCRADRSGGAGAGEGTGTRGAELRVPGNGGGSDGVWEGGALKTGPHPILRHIPSASEALGTWKLPDCLLGKCITCARVGIHLARSCKNETQSHPRYIGCEHRNPPLMCLFQIRHSLPTSP